MKGDQLLFPHVLRFFKGFGSMDFMTTTKRNVDVLYRETVEEPVDEEGNEEP